MKLLFPLALYAILATLAHAADRVALVIGNSRYSNLPKSKQLESSVRNAREVGAALERMGYVLVTGVALTDANREGMIAASEALVTHGEHADAAVVYFSGHSAQIDGEQYLFPTDTPDLTEGSIRKRRAIPLSTTIMRSLSEAGIRSKVIILDCNSSDRAPDQPVATLPQGRNSATRDAGSGFGHEGRGFYFAFANTAGKAGGDSTSPFTAQLLAHLTTGSEEGIATIFLKVKAALLQGSGQDLSLWTNDTLEHDFALAFSPSASSAGPKTESGKALPDADSFAGKRAGEVWTNSQATAFRWCPAGTFLMGSSLEDQIIFTRDNLRLEDEEQHPVKITKGFWMSQYEVTQREWASVMGRTLKDQAQLMLHDDTFYETLGNRTMRDMKGASRDTDPDTQFAQEAPELPIYYVSWNEAVEYCERLSAREHSKGSLLSQWCYRLPTEAQWEYACRAGTFTTLYSGPMSIKGAYNAPALGEIAWYGGNSSQGYRGRGWDTSTWAEKQFPGGFAGPRRVGQKKPNAWGLYDMLGNVWEWCADWYTSEITENAVDPVGPLTGTERVGRGGGWLNFASLCRSAFRQCNEPGIRDDLMGFRPVLVRCQ
jgi:formylglycine-generating enzyme required for sulfatase activity